MGNEGAGKLCSQRGQDVLRSQPHICQLLLQILQENLQLLQRACPELIKTFQVFFQFLLLRSELLKLGLIPEGKFFAQFAGKLQGLGLNIAALGSSQQSQKLIFEQREPTVFQHLLVVVKETLQGKYGGNAVDIRLRENGLGFLQQLGILGELLPGSIPQVCLNSVTDEVQQLVLPGYPVGYRINVRHSKNDMPDAGCPDQRQDQILLGQTQGRIGGDDHQSSVHLTKNAQGHLGHGGVVVQTRGIQNINMVLAEY